jgi:hypothetical protein
MKAAALIKDKGETADNRLAMARMKEVRGSAWLKAWFYCFVTPHP